MHMFPSLAFSALGWMALKVLSSQRTWSRHWCWVPLGRSGLPAASRWLLHRPQHGADMQTVGGPVMGTLGVWGVLELASPWPSWCERSLQSACCHPVLLEWGRMFSKTPTLSEGGGSGWRGTGENSTELAGTGLQQMRADVVWSSSFPLLKPLN